MKGNWQSRSRNRSKSKKSKRLNKDMKLGMFVMDVQNRLKEVNTGLTV